MKNLNAYRDDLMTRLQVMEGQIESMAEKVGIASADGSAAIDLFVERWQETLARARRELVDLGAQGERWSEHRGRTDEVWRELKEIVANAQGAC